MDGFEELATGAQELEVTLHKGDIAIRVSESAGWSLEWSSQPDEEPMIERDGRVLRIRQHSNYGLRHATVRLTVPPGLEVVELHTGLGRIEAEGLRARLHMDTGSGALALRQSAGEATVSTGNGELTIEEYEGRVTASSGNGRLHIERLNGSATLSTGNGRVELRDAEGPIHISTGNGDVELNGVGGEAELSTGHGKIAIAQARGLAVRATTAMGAVRVQGGSVRALRLNSMMGEVSCSAVLQPGTHELTTGMGSVTLELPAGAAVRVDAQTGFGQVHSDFPLVRVGRSGPLGFGGVRMVGTIGDGEPAIDVALRSGKGAINLMRAGEYAATRGSDTAPERPAATSYGATAEAPSRSGTASAVAEAEPPAEQSTLAILEALARGDISPDEADDLLTRRSWT